MPDAFVPFDIAFAPPSPAALEEANGICELGAPSPAIAQPGQADVCAEIRRFHAALADAVDAALHEIVRDVACEVLGRELQLATADVAAIARSALERFASDVPLRLRVHPHDASALATLGLPVVQDAALRRGDVVIELRSGTIDASLGTRLETVLERR